jgi:hypothetical protein
MPGVRQMIYLQQSNPHEQVEKSLNNPRLPVLGVSLEKGNAHIRPYFQNEKNYFLLAA